MEVERAEASPVQEAVVIAEKMDNIFRNHSWRGYRCNSNGHSGNEGPDPMLIKVIPTRKFPRVSGEKKKRCLTNKLCCICKRRNHVAKNHYNSNDRKYNGPKR